MGDRLLISLLGAARPPARPDVRSRQMLVHLDIWLPARAKKHTRDDVFPMESAAPALITGTLLMLLAP